MFINTLINKSQNIMKPVYDRSFILQNIDKLIGLNIYAVIFSSLFAQSDSIGYFAIFAIILTAIKMLTKTGEKLELDIADKFLLIYFIFVIISVAGSSLLFLSIKGFLKTVTYLGFYVSVINYLKDNKDKIKYIFLAFVLCASYEAVIALLQNFGAVEEISGWQDMSRLNPEDVMTRVYGTLKPYNPNLFGGYMLSLVPAFIALPCIKKFESSKNKLIFGLITLFLGLFSVSAIILTGCRGAYVGFFFELLILIFVGYKLLKPDFRKIFTTIISFTTILVVFIIISVSSLRARIFSIFAMRGDSSNSFRFNVYNSCLHMFKDNWLLGIGCGNQNFREIYGLYMRTGFDALSAYNIYLETAVESGIFALISFVGFLSALLIKGFRFVFNSNNIQDKIFILAALLSVTGILTHGFVDTVFFRPQIQFVFWIMVGIISVLTYKKCSI